MVELRDRPLALVTGASSGIGRAFAERLAADGYDLLILARRKDRLDDLAGELRGRGAAVETISADLTDSAALHAVEGRLASDGRMTLLVNNAGFGGYGPFLEMDPDLAERQIALHLTALVRMTRAVLPGMVQRGRGAIVNVASTLAFTGPISLQRPKRATYAATKAYIVTFTQLLAQELEGTGVRVQVLCPGLVRTEFHDALGGRPPGAPVLEAPDIVAASLAALDLGEVVCLPQLADAGTLERIAEAQNALWGEARIATEIAARYKPGR